jgi:hypothetical protein
MHRTPALRPARTCRSAVISTRPARTRRSAIVSARSVPTLIKTTLARRPTWTSIDRLAWTHRTGINRTPWNRARRTRRHTRTRRRWSSRCWCCRTLRQSRNHIGARRNHGPCLRLTRQIRLGRRTQRLRRTGWRARRTRPNRLRTRRRRNARQTRRRRPRRAGRSH